MSVIPAEYYNSSLNNTERERIRTAVRSKSVKLLYIAPEQLGNGNTLSFLRTKDFIARAGYALSPSSRFDVVLSDAITQVRACKSVAPGWKGRVAEDYEKRGKK